MRRKRLRALVECHVRLGLAVPWRRYLDPRSAQAKELLAREKERARTGHGAEVNDDDEGHEWLVGDQQAHSRDAPPSATPDGQMPFGARQANLYRGTPAAWSPSEQAQYSEFFEAYDSGSDYHSEGSQGSDWGELASLGFVAQARDALPAAKRAGAAAALIGAAAAMARNETDAHFQAEATRAAVAAAQAVADAGGDARAAEAAAAASFELARVRFERATLLAMARLHSKLASRNADGTIEWAPHVAALLQGGESLEVTLAAALTSDQAGNGGGRQGEKTPHSGERAQLDLIARYNSRAERERRARLAKAKIALAYRKAGGASNTPAPGLPPGLSPRNISPAHQRAASAPRAGKLDSAARARRHMDLDLELNSEEHALSRTAGHASRTPPASHTLPHPGTGEGPLFSESRFQDGRFQDGLPRDRRAFPSEQRPAARAAWSEGASGGSDGACVPPTGGGGMCSHLPASVPISPRGQLDGEELWQVPFAFRNKPGRQAPKPQSPAERLSANHSPSPRNANVHAVASHAATSAVGSVLGGHPSRQLTCARAVVANGSATGGANGSAYETAYRPPLGAVNGTHGAAADIWRASDDRMSSESGASSAGPSHGLSGPASAPASGLFGSPRLSEWQSGRSAALPEWRRTSEPNAQIGSLSAASGYASSAASSATAGGRSPRAQAHARVAAVAQAAAAVAMADAMAAEAEEAYLESVWSELPPTFANPAPPPGSSPFSPTAARPSPRGGSGGGGAHPGSQGVPAYGSGGGQGATYAPPYEYAHVRNPSVAGGQASAQPHAGGGKAALESLTVHALRAPSQQQQPGASARPGRARAYDGQRSRALCRTHASHVQPGARLPSHLLPEIYTSPAAVAAAVGLGTGKPSAHPSTSNHKQGAHSPHQEPSGRTGAHLIGGKGLTESELLRALVPPPPPPLSTLPPVPRPTPAMARQALAARSPQHPPPPAPIGGGSPRLHWPAAAV
ncbi:hypothetical protein T492DRAFT_23786 [Pavlovales sp. CCMP2436]|nr:hypothetical protein T492DRAFT_23786 [Pavlovales sp. CCMP2436]